MRGLLVIGLVAALGLAGAAGAQDAEQERTATVAAGTAGGGIVVGDVAYDLAEGEVFQVCIDGRTDDLDGSRLVLRPFARTASDGWLAWPSFAAWATGNLAAARQGDCYVLDPEPVTR